MVVSLCTGISSGDSRTPCPWMYLLSFGFGLLALALGFEHGGLSVDFADFLSCFTLLLRLAHLPDHTSLGNIDLGLVGSTFVSLPTKEREILAARSVLKFFDVGIVAITSLIPSNSLILTSLAHLFPKI